MKYLPRTTRDTDATVLPVSIVLVDYDIAAESNDPK